MVDSANEFFYDNFIESSTEEESSDDDTDILVATLLVNEHFARERPKFRGSIDGHAPALDRTESVVILCCMMTIFSQSHCSLLGSFGADSTCVDGCLTVFGRE